MTNMLHISSHRQYGASLSDKMWDSILHRPVNSNSRADRKVLQGFKKNYYDANNELERSRNHSNFGRSRDSENHPEKGITN